MIGKTVSHYEILELVGEGGMGVVYRARDSRLERDVALKFLNDHAGGEPELLERFRREARLLAELNHAGIATIHDIGEHDGRPYLALELLDGETLASRLKAGALPADQTVALLREVATALAAAHAHGIVHRDLKPANIMLAPEGGAKILDFGLARILPLVGESRGSDAKTVTISELTRPGRLLGTAGYMSPEQVRGEAVDLRTDVWAFGCILFECLTGKKAFPGSTLSESVAAVLMGEPDWSLLPRDLPADLRRLLDRCLRKDPQRRYHAVSDVGIELEESLTTDRGTMADGAGSSASRSRVLPAVLIAAAISLVVGGFGWQQFVLRRSPAPEPFVFALPVADDVVLGYDQTPPVSLSPDGRRIVFRGTVDGVSRLHYFELGKSEVIALPGTENAIAPFFSPSGEWIAFFSEYEVQKISIADGTVIPVCHHAVIREHHGTWGDDGTILISGRYRMGYEIHAVSCDGGQPRRLRIDDALGQFIMPSYLPGAGAALVLATHGQSFDNYWLAAVEIESGAVHPLIEFTSGRWGFEDLHPQYLGTGHIVYVEDRVIKAIPFDAQRLVLRGDPVVMTGRLTRTLPAFVGVSRAGTIAFCVDKARDPDAETMRRPLWFDRDGMVDSLGIELPGRPMYPVVAADGRRVSLTVMGKDHRRCWAVDLERNVLSPLTFGQNDHVGLWSPDGRRLAFSSDRDGPSNIYLSSMRAGEKPARLTWSESHQCPSCWTPDGRVIVFTEFTETAGGDIWLLDPDDPGNPRALVATDQNETHGMVSPDGKWLAYASEASGIFEVYLDRYPDTGTPVRASLKGGHSPLWSPDGRELFYLSPLGSENTDGGWGLAAMVVAIGAGDSLAIGPQRRMFTGVFPHGGSARPHWDISPDGSRFMLISGNPPVVRAQDLRVVLDWSARLSAPGP